MQELCSGGTETVELQKEETMALKAKVIDDLYFYEFIRSLICIKNFFYTSKWIRIFSIIIDKVEDTSVHFILC